MLRPSAASAWPCHLRRESAVHVFFAGEAPVRRIERIEDDDGSLNFSLQDCDLEEQAEDLRKANHLSGQTTPEDETTSKEARQLIFLRNFYFLD